GRFASLAADGDTWKRQVIALGEQYKDQYCFTKVYWTPKTINGNYFDAFYRATYTDAARIAKDCELVVPGTMSKWKYMYQKDPKQGEAAGFTKPDFDDKAWKTTDVNMESWATLGHTYDHGALWYRTEVAMPAIPAGKKVHLWVSSTDGAARVFVNGKHVPYVAETVQPDKTVKKEVKIEADGYCQPFSFDITSAVKPGAANQITILGTKTAMINELGTGGLLGPVVIYREK